MFNFTACYHILLEIEYWHGQDQDQVTFLVVFLGKGWLLFYLKIIKIPWSYVRLKQCHCKQFGNTKLSSQHYTKRSYSLICSAKPYFKIEDFLHILQKGQEIHAELNDIDRKAWVVKNKAERLWTLIYRYEMRNMTKVDIVAPVKRIFINKNR